MQFDTVIAGGRVVDGSGGAPYPADVGIVADRIAAVGRLDGADSSLWLDAAGLTVTPGFVDIHGHSDLPLIVDGAATSKVEQGVTTEVIGNCGMSAAPYWPGSWILGLRAGDAAERLGRVWSDQASYLATLESVALGYNVASLVGFGAVRRVAIESASTNPGQQLQAELQVALDAGAFGISMGLFYQPDSSASRDDLERAASVAASRDLLLSVHVRDEGDFSVGLQAAIEECLSLSRSTGVRLQVSHLKALGPAGWSALDHVLETIEASIAIGVDIQADQYPYAATETSLAKAVYGARAPSARGFDNSLDLIAIAEGVGRRGGAERLVLSHVESRPEYAGLTLLEAARRLGCSDAEAALTLISEGEATVMSFALQEDDVIRIMQRPWVMFGSDGMALTRSLASEIGHPHPRNFGAFPHALGRYVRDLGVMRFEDAIKRMTYAPAERIGLEKRGLIAPGNYADLVVLDSAVIDAPPNFLTPMCRPLGIRWVTVNGQVVVDGGLQTGARPGRVLRR